MSYPELPVANCQQCVNGLISVFCHCRFVHMNTFIALDCVATTIMEAVVRDYPDYRDDMAVII